MVLEPDVDTEGLAITVKFEGESLLAHVVGSTLAIDGHGQPVERHLEVTVTPLNYDAVVKRTKLLTWLVKREYTNIKVGYFDEQ